MRLHWYNTHLNGEVLLFVRQKRNYLIVLNASFAYPNSGKGALIMHLMTSFHTTT